MKKNFLSDLAKKNLTSTQNFKNITIAMLNDKDLASFFVKQAIVFLRLRKEFTEFPPMDELTEQVAICIYAASENIIAASCAYKLYLDQGDDALIRSILEAKRNKDILDTIIGIIKSTENQENYSEAN